MIKKGCCLLLLGMSLMQVSCVKSDKPVEVHEYVNVGDSLPQFSVTLLDGMEMNNDNWVGKQLVLVFFSIGCPDCQKELPEIEYFYQKMKDRPDICVLGVSRGGGMKAVGGYWKTHHLTFPCSPQEDRKVYELFASAIVPRIYLVDGQGKVTHKFDDSNMPLVDTLFTIVK